jgi:hypothetical protein
MLCTMDAFVETVEDARYRLSKQEGRTVSMREVLRRAGYTDAQRAGVFYHLNKQAEWPNGHDVPPELIARLTGPRQDGQPGKVLPLSHEELTRAAQVARGYNIEMTGADLPAIYARFLGDREITEEEKRAVTSRLLQIIAQETASTK